jgi:hypothetical protein
MDIKISIAQIKIRMNNQDNLEPSLYLIEQLQLHENHILFLPALRSAFS